MLATNPPTDLKLVRTIYKQYYAEFVQYKRGDDARRTKNYIPIDIPSIARLLHTHQDIVFSSLYYRLAPLHGKPDVPFFMHGWPEPGERALLSATVAERDVVNFAVLTGVYATLREDNKRHLLAIWIAALALVISIASLFLK
jgi:hypothetical protein